MGGVGAGGVMAGGQGSPRTMRRDVWRPTPADGPAAAPRWELWLRASAPAPAEQPPARLTDGRADAWWRAELARLERFAPPPPDASSDEEL